MNTTEEKWTYPAEEAQRIFLGPGLELAIADFKPEKDVMVDIELEHSSLEFCFCLLGKIRRNFQNGKNTILINSGDASLWFSPASETTIEYIANGPILGIGIRVNSSLFRSLPENEPEQIPAFFRGILPESNESFYCHAGKMTASTRIAVYQILNCVFQGFAKQVYLSGKVLELLAIVLADIHLERRTLLNPQDRDKLHQAREILVENLEDPPSLMELSHQVGLNDYKLKMGFREVFRTTVYGYLRQERLELARKLLEEGELNVTEVSYSVGYSSLSHFTKAFTSKFGTRPSAYLSETRRKKDGNCHLPKQ